jgi:hypothetical protein
MECQLIRSTRGIEGEQHRVGGVLKEKTKPYQDRRGQLTFVKQQEKANGKEFWPQVSS